MGYRNISHYENFRATLHEDCKHGNDCYLVLSVALLCTFISIMLSV
jgi:hypothetical protein